MSSRVFISIKDRRRGYSSIYDARPYQADAYHIYMDLGKPAVKEFALSGATYGLEGDLVFSIRAFDTTGLKGTYEPFCVMVNENKEEYLLSNDKDMLQRFTGYMNRVWYADC